MDGDALAETVHARVPGAVLRAGDPIGGPLDMGVVERLARARGCRRKDEGGPRGEAKEVEGRGFQAALFKRWRRISKHEQCVLTQTA
jgi:hypothetical protein